jgi:hypothetical protein
VPNPLLVLEEIRTFIRMTSAEIVDGTLREKTRKARRMTLLLSLVGIIWCKGILVTKESVGGFEIQGLVPMIPYLIGALLIFFFVQFWFYKAADKDHARYLKLELARNLQKLKEIDIEAVEDTEKFNVIDDVIKSGTDTKRLMKNNDRILFWDCISLYIVFGAAIAAFIGRYAFGFFVA